MSKVQEYETEELDADLIDPNGPPPPPEGMYEADIAKLTPGKSKDDLPKINVKLTLTRFLETGEELERIVYDDVPMGSKKGGLAKVAFRVKGLADAAHVQLGKIGNSDEALERICDQIQSEGTSVYVKIYHDSFTGSPRAKVRRYYAEEALPEAR